jgi:hypothetical protein
MIGKIISTLGEPGVAEGLINYQKDVDKQREKVRERIEARMLAIQKLMISRGVSSAKAKTYSADVATVVNRLRIKQGENAGEFAEGTEIILQALRNDPSSAKVLKSMIDKGDKAMNYPLSASQIVEFFPVLQTTGGGTPSGYMSDEAIQKVINSGGLEDFDTFLQVMRGASTPASTSGTSVFDSPFFPETKTEKVNLQTKTFDDILMNIATKQLEMTDEGSSENAAINLAINEGTKGNPSKLRNMFGVDGVITLQKDYTNVPAFSDAFQNNPVIQRYYNTNLKIQQEEPNFLNQIREALRQNPTKDFMRQYDNEFGEGASNYLLRMSM